MELLRGLKDCLALYAKSFTLCPMSCPICQNPTEGTFRPFCSKRCQLVDLNNWFGEAYAIPVVENSNDDAADEALDAVWKNPALPPSS